MVKKIGGEAGFVQRSWVVGNYKGNSRWAEKGGGGRKGVTKFDRRRICRMPILFKKNRKRKEGNKKKFAYGKGEKIKNKEQ